MPHHKDDKITLTEIEGLNDMLSKLPDAAQIKQCALRDASNLTAEQIVKWQGLLDLMKKSEYVDNSGKIKPEKLPDNLAVIDDIPDLSKTVQVDDDQSFTDAEKAKGRANIGAVSAADIPDAFELKDGSVTAPKLADDVLKKVVQVDNEQSFTDVEEIQGRENVGIYNSDITLDSLARKADTEQILYKDFDVSNLQTEITIIPKLKDAAIKILSCALLTKIKLLDNSATAYIGVNPKTKNDDANINVYSESKNSNKKHFCFPIYYEGINYFEQDIKIYPENVFVLLKGRIYYTLYYFPDTLK